MSALADLLGGDTIMELRDAIHGDGPEADAIRESLGLTIERAVYHDGRKSPRFAQFTRPVRRVVGEWQDVPAARK